MPLLAPALGLLALALAGCDELLAPQARVTGGLNSQGMGAAIHTAKTSALGWAIAVMCGGEPQNGADPASRFFDAIDPNR